jgi:hypothetical protein
MIFDALYNPYPSRRSTVFAKNGMRHGGDVVAAY